MSKKINIEMFSPAKLAMIQECKNHPVLMDYLSTYESDDWGGAVGEIAAYCLICMEGNYMPMELERLYDMCTFKLKEKRAIIIDTIQETKQ